MPRASKSFPSPLSKDLNASRRSEPRLNQELPQEVFDHLHARREAGHPYKYTTKDVRAILRYVNDKPEPACPAFSPKPTRSNSTGLAAPHANTVSTPPPSANDNN